MLSKSLIIRPCVRFSGLATNLEGFKEKNLSEQLNTEERAEYARVSK